MTKLNPYLFFGGNCEEAFEFYKSVFGGDYHLSRFKDAPQTDRQIFREADEKVMHVSLPINSETTLMGCDVAELPASANNFALFIRADHKEAADRLFSQLSAGGTIGMPMTETFWGSYYGFTTDKFGINWKISFDLDTE